MLGQLQAQEKKLWNLIYMLVLTALLYTEFILNKMNVQETLCLNVKIVLGSAREFY